MKNRLILTNNEFVYIGYFYGSLINNILTICSSGFIKQYEILNYEEFDRKWFSLQLNGNLFGINISLNKRYRGITIYQKIPPDIQFGTIREYIMFTNFLKNKIIYEKTSVMGK